MIGWICEKANKMVSELQRLGVFLDLQPSDKQGAEAQQALLGLPG